MIKNEKKEALEKQDSNVDIEAKLYKKASLRVGFKIHLSIFFLANLMLWVIWYFIFRGGEDPTSAKAFNAVLFVSIVWFIIIIAHYLIAYQWSKPLVEKELIHLKQKLIDNESKSEKEKQEPEKEE